jgi:hypothetical protein
LDPPPQALNASSVASLSLSEAYEIGGLTATKHVVYTSLTHEVLSQLQTRTEKYSVFFLVTKLYAAAAILY